MNNTPRTYVVGLPVVVTVTDDGFVSVEVDLAELPATVREEGGSADHPAMLIDVDRDVRTLRRWVETHAVRNEDHVSTEVDR